VKLNRITAPQRYKIIDLNPEYPDTQVCALLNKISGLMKSFS